MSGEVGADPVGAELPEIGCAFGWRLAGQLLLLEIDDHVAGIEPEAVGAAHVDRPVDGDALTVEVVAPLVRGDLHRPTHLVDAGEHALNGHYGIVRAGLDRPV